MAKHHLIGQNGENIAIDHLVKHDYIILEKNWRYKKAEIDIIAQKDNLLIIIEVKSRSSAFFGNPEDFVSQQKLDFMVDAAQIYMEQKNLQCEVRFDVIGILFYKDNTFQLQHFEDIYFPEW